MPRTFKGSETTMNLLVHTCVDKAPITELKIILFTTNPEVVFEINEGINVVGNIATFTVPNYAFGNMEDGVINYIVNGLMDDEAFITERQSNYYLKTPTNYTPSEGDDCPELIEITITENGVYEGAYDKVIVDVPQEGGDCPELEEITIVENGTYEGAYDKVVVDVPQEGGDCPELEEITIVENGTYEGAYDKVVVDVPQEGGETSCTLEPLVVTENGWYEPKAEEFGYLNVNENSAFDTGVKLVEDSVIEIYFNTGDNDSNIPTLIGCEDTDWSENTFAVRWFNGILSIKIGNCNFDISLGAEDSDTNFHKLKFGRYEGVWFDDEYKGSMDYDTWEITQNTIYIGAMHNTTDGDTNGVFRPWNGYLGNVKIYGEKNDEVREFTFTCGDFGKWGEYETDGEILPNLMGDGGATYTCCKQYGDKPFDGYSSVSVNIDVEPFKEEGRDEIRNKLQSINITANGRYSTDDMELIPYIEFDGNSYFDTTIPFGENTKIEVAITKPTYEGDEQVIGVAHYDLLATEEYGGFGIVLGNGYAYGAFGFAKTYDIGFSYGEEQILTLNKNGLSSNLYGRNGWIDESGLNAGGLYGHTIGLGKIKSISDGWSGGFNGLIRYVKIWTDGNDDSTMTLFRPKNMAQGGFGLVNSEGVEYRYIENLGEGTATFKDEWVKKYGEGWKEINVNVIYEPIYNFTETTLKPIKALYDSANSDNKLWINEMIEYNNTHPDLTSNGMMYLIPDGTNPLHNIYGYYGKSGIFGNKGAETIKPFGKTLVTPWVYNENNSPSTTIILPDYWIGGFDCTEVEYIDRVFEGAETIRAFTTLKNLGKSFTSVNTLDLSALTYLNQDYYDGDCFEKIANSVYDFNVMNSNGISNSNVKLPSNVKQTAIDAWTAKGWRAEIVEAE